MKLNDETWSIEWHREHFDTFVGTQSYSIPCPDLSLTFRRGTTTVDITASAVVGADAMIHAALMASMWDMRRLMSPLKEIRTDRARWIVGNVDVSSANDTRISLSLAEYTPPEPVVIYRKRKKKKKRKVDR